MEYKTQMLKLVWGPIKANLCGYFTNAITSTDDKSDILLVFDPRVSKFG